MLAWQPITAHGSRPGSGQGAQILAWPPDNWQHGVTFVTATAAMAADAATAALEDAAARHTHRRQHGYLRCRSLPCGIKESDAMKQASSTAAHLNACLYASSSAQSKMHQGRMRTSC